MHEIQNARVVTTPSKLLKCKSGHDTVMGDKFFMYNICNGVFLVRKGTGERDRLKIENV
jgi:hypothetical protein